MRWSFLQGKKRSLEEQDVSKEQEGLRQVAEAIAGSFRGKATDEPKRLDQTRWTAAAENLSIAYAMCGAWHYYASRVHFRNRMKIAGRHHVWLPSVSDIPSFFRTAKAASETPSRRVVLAQHYHVVGTAEWSQRAERGTLLASRQIVFFGARVASILQVMRGST